MKLVANKWLNEITEVVWDIYSLVRLYAAHSEHSQTWTVQHSLYQDGSHFDKGEYNPFCHCWA